MTLRSYIAGRRLARAAAEVRDSDDRLLDIALKYGWSSQEAMTNTNSSLKVYTKNIRKNHIFKFLLNYLYTF